ncbi:MAG: sulfotransferase [Hyphomonadaceae bacterium]
MTDQRSGAQPLGQLVSAMLEAWRRGDAGGAERAAQAVLSLAPREANALQVLAAVRLGQGRPAEAVHLLRAADSSAPDNASILNMLGLALRRAGAVSEARDALLRAGELGQGEAWRNLGELEAAAGRADAALLAFERAVAAQPASASAQAALSRTLEQRHDLARAKIHADLALKADPQSQTARLARAQIAVRERDDAAAEILAPLLSAAATTPINRAIAWGLMGEIHDRAGRFHDAFAAFAAANAQLAALNSHLLNAEDSPFHPSALARLTRFLVNDGAAAWRHPAHYEQQAPVFLVGFPRSGTTLLEQILASHSRIVCLEERDVLASSVVDLMMSDAALTALERMPEAEIHQRRRRYWESVGAHVSVGAHLFVDKLPLNIVFLPLIARIFPDAKIIFALRDPRDVLLSCFQQRFGMNAAMAQLLDLEGGARYYGAVMDLAAEARARLPLRLHELRYEDVVGDLDGAAPGLAAFLEVDFEAGMLEFSATARRRVINTPSARQVIEPIYTRSVGRWRNYAAELAPVLPTLDAWAARWGYAG